MVDSSSGWLCAGVKVEIDASRNTSWSTASEADNSENNHRFVEICRSYILLSCQQLLRAFHDHVSKGILKTARRSGLKFTYLAANNPRSRWRRVLRLLDIAQRWVGLCAFALCGRSSFIFDLYLRVAQTASFATLMDFCIHRSWKRSSLVLYIAHLVSPKETDSSLRNTIASALTYVLLHVVSRKTSAPKCGNSMNVLRMSPT